MSKVAWLNRSLVYSFSLLFAALVIAVGCEPVPPTPTPLPPSATSTRTATRVPETATSIPPIVGFPTGVPNPTTSATLSAPLTTQRASPALPLVQLTSPVSNTQISVNQTFNVVIYAAADSGITRIEVTDDGATVRVENAPVPAQVFSAIIPWTPTQIGNHVLRAVAYDTNNRASAPDDALVAVTTDTRKPTSIIVYPIGIPQVEFGSALQIYGVATDEVGVTQVDLWVDNQIYTYLAASNANGQAAFPFVFSWLALTPGTHNFFVRAHDNQDQTNDSALLKVLVVDTQTPSVNVTFDRMNAPVGESITVTVSALDASGIQKIDLLSGKEIVSSVSSPSPARQTWLTTQVVLQNPNPGDYSIVARVYNANGNTNDSIPQTVSFLRPGQITPTPVLTATPTRPRARATITPSSQPPPAPKVNIVSPTEQFSQAAPLRVTFSAQGNAELDRIELWRVYPGQSLPQIVCLIDAHATTQKTGQCEWSPPTADWVTLYAQAIDIYHQVGRSTPISGFVGVPNLPTPTAMPPTLSARWTASTSQGPMTATFRQTGATLRGDFKMSGIDTLGRITAGNVKADHLTFTADLSSPTTPTPSTDTTLTMDFDCAIDMNAGTLTCTYRDSRGRTGAAFFRRENTP